MTPPTRKKYHCPRCHWHGPSYSSTCPKCGKIMRKYGKLSDPVCEHCKV